MWQSLKWEKPRLRLNAPVLCFSKEPPALRRIVRCLLRQSEAILRRRRIAFTCPPPNFIFHKLIIVFASESHSYETKPF